MVFKEVLSFIPWIGDGLSFVTQKVIQFIAKYGVNLTVLQSQILLLLIFGVSIYILLAVLTIAKKLLKWGIVALLIFLAVSVVVSMFA